MRASSDMKMLGFHKDWVLPYREYLEEIKTWKENKTPPKERGIRERVTGILPFAYKIVKLKV
jgi:hypothetical protein